MKFCNLFILVCEVGLLSLMHQGIKGKAQEKVPRKREYAYITG